MKTISRVPAAIIGLIIAGGFAYGCIKQYIAFKTAKQMFTLSVDISFLKEASHHEDMFSVFLAGMVATLIMTLFAQLAGAPKHRLAR